MFKCLCTNEFVLGFHCLQGDLEEEIPESCSSSDDDLELDETNLGEGLFITFNVNCLSHTKSSMFCF